MPLIHTTKAQAKPLFTLEAHPDKLIAELTVEIDYSARRNQTELSTGIARLLNQIQRMNEKIAKQPETTVQSVLDA